MQLSTGQCPHPAVHLPICFAVLRSRVLATSSNAAMHNAFEPDFACCCRLWRFMLLNTRVSPALLGCVAVWRTHSHDADMALLGGSRTVHMIRGHTPCAVTATGVCLETACQNSNAHVALCGFHHAYCRCHKQCTLPWVVLWDMTAQMRRT